MAKEVIPFEKFLERMPQEYIEFVVDLNEYFLANNLRYEIKEQKTGYVVAYIHTPTKKTVINYVFRKKGPLIRIYADNILNYLEIIDTLPEDLKAQIKKSSPCKRMLNPNDCNSRCVQGFDFIMDGERQQKCRYNCFLIYLSNEHNPFIKKLAESEVAYR